MVRSSQYIFQFPNSSLATHYTFDVHRACTGPWTAWTTGHLSVKNAVIGHQSASYASVDPFSLLPLWTRWLSTGLLRSGIRHITDGLTASSASVIPPHLSVSVSTSRHIRLYRCRSDRGCTVCGPNVITYVRTTNLTAIFIATSAGPTSADVRIIKINKECKRDCKVLETRQLTCRFITNYY